MANIAADVPVHRLVSTDHPGFTALAARSGARR